MNSLRKVLLIAIGAGTVALGAAAPAGANPADDPCQLAVSFLCRFVPIAPDLDHDIDLTQDPAVINGQHLPEMSAADPNLDEGRPADICANGCV